MRNLLGELSVLRSAYELKIDRLEELRLFFIALLWRASASNKKLFANVSIGGFSDLAKRLLTSNSPGSVGDFSTIIHCSGADQQVIAEPVRVRHSGVLFYRFYLGRFTADIKVSSQPTPKQLLPAVIGSKEVLVVLRTERDFGLVDAASRVAKQLTTHSTGPARKGRVGR